MPIKTTNTIFEKLPLIIDENLDGTLTITPSLGNSFFTVKHSQDHFNDYYKAEKVILHKSYAEIFYFTDEGLTADKSMRKAGFNRYQIIDNVLILLVDGEA